MTPSRNKIVELITRERGEIERAGVRESLSVGLGVRRAVLSAYQKRNDPSLALRDKMARLVGPIVQAMVRSHLTGLRRSHLIAAPHLPSTQRAFRRVPSVHATAIEFLRQQTKLAAEQVGGITALYEPVATAAVVDATEAINVAIQQSIQASVAQGEHVRLGMKRLRKTLGSAGLGDVADPMLSPHRLEALYRTHVQLAYSAGRQQANRDPAIQEILWGYEYSAVGDARTRPAHQALNGTRLPTEHARWAEITPPNGWNCRCVLIEVFRDDPQLANESLPPETVLDERGQTVRVGADEGFAFNPGEAFGAMALPTVIRAEASRA